MIHGKHLARYINTSCRLSCFFNKNKFRNRQKLRVFFYYFKPFKLRCLLCTLSESNIRMYRARSLETYETRISQIRHHGIISIVMIQKTRRMDRFAAVCQTANLITFVQPRVIVLRVLYERHHAVI